MKNKNNLMWLISISISAFLITSTLYAEDIKFDQDLTQKIQKIIENINTIKPGMTRADLLKIFTTEGGLSTHTWRRYVYQSCPYIKVDVEFKPAGNIAETLQESSDDIIVKISQPFLEFSIYD